MTLSFFRSFTTHPNQVFICLLVHIGCTGFILGTWITCVSRTTSLLPLPLISALTLDFRTYAWGPAATGQVIVWITSSIVHRFAGLVAANISINNRLIGAHYLTWDVWVVKCPAIGNSASVANRPTVLDARYSHYRLGSTQIIRILFFIGHIRRRWKKLTGDWISYIQC